MLEENRRELLRSMNQIAVEMPETIYNEYFDKLGSDIKYPLAIFVDAFNSVDVFCYSMQHVSLTQAAAVLRLLLEQTTILWILAEHPDFLPKFVEHYKFRKEINNLSRSKQIDAISEKYNIPNNPHALTYLDYGWIDYGGDIRCGEDAMIIYARFDDINSWRKKFLDKLTHTSLTTTDLLGETGDFPIANNFTRIAAKLFDHLCVSFHKMTNFDFVFNDIDLFHNNFRKNYELFLADLKEE